MQNLDEQDPAVTTAFPLLIATAALILRLFVPLSSDFPLNDGGLFYRMILDLKANGFLPPATTSYNAHGLPFAYPPLGLYLAAALHHFVGLELLDILRVAPPIISCLCLLPVWKIICTLQNKPVTRLYSFAAYALSYSAYEWTIMGGGITRAPGMFFALLAIFFYLRSTAGAGIMPAVFCGLACGLTALSHPHSSLFLAASLTTLFLLREPRPTPLQCCAIPFFAVAVSLPWFFNLAQRGLLPTLLQAAGTGHIADAGVFRFVEVLFVGLPILPLVTNILAILGILRAVFLRHWYILIWFTLVYMVPRLSSLYAMLPLSLLAGYGGITLHELVSSFAQRQAEKDGGRESPFRLMTRSRVIFAVVVASLLSSSILKTVHLGTTVLSDEVVREFSALSTTTPPDARFLVMTTGKEHHHHITEWFPAFSLRHSLLTPEGMEWLDAGKFYEILLRKIDLYNTISDPMHRIPPELQRVFDDADYLIVDDESRFAELDQRWKVSKPFDGLTLYGRRALTD